MSTEATEPNLSTVRRRRAAIAKQLTALETEDAELAVAERVLTRLAPTVNNTTISTATVTSAGRFAGVAAQTAVGGFATATTSAPVTQKDLVVATLRARKEPWIESSRDLQAEIQDVHGVYIGDNSLMPLLTVMKNDGIIKRDAENKIALAERLVSRR